MAAPCSLGPRSLEKLQPGGQVTLKSPSFFLLTINCLPLPFNSHLRLAQNSRDAKHNQTRHHFHVSDPFGAPFWQPWSFSSCNQETATAAVKFSASKVEGDISNSSVSFYQRITGLKLELKWQSQSQSSNCITCFLEGSRSCSWNLGTWIADTLKEERWANCMSCLNIFGFFGRFVKSFRWKVFKNYFRWRFSTL